MLNKNKISAKTEHIINQTKAVWQNILTEIPDALDSDFDFANKFPLLDIVDVTNSTVAIFNYSTFRLEYLSENVQERIGYPKEELLVQGLKLLSNGLNPEHSNFFLLYTQQLETVFESLETGKNSNILAISCGFKYIHPQIGEIRLLMQHYFIENNGNRPFRALSTIQDVTHLMKDDFYFVRIIYGEKHEKVNLYHSGDSKINHQNDIISNREKEVLIQISKGLETDEIAQVLSISRNTVNNHRQNMLNRLGVKDTTALLEIARLCHIL